MKATADGESLLLIRRQNFWKTLLVLGFDPKEACTGIYAAVELGPECIFAGYFSYESSRVISTFHAITT